jgi:hypothetical protein
MRMLRTQTMMTNHIAHRLSIHSPQAPTRPSIPTTRGKKTVAVGFPSKMTDSTGTRLVRLRKREQDHGDNHGRRVGKHVGSPITAFTATSMVPP